MTRDFADACAKYLDGTIQKAGKVELLDKFLARFPRASKDTFDKIVRRGLRPPTPDEEDWIIDNVNHYWARYKSYYPSITQLSIEDVNQTA